MTALGHPIVGDTMYGTPSPLIDRQALHAAVLGFRHPEDERAMRFEAPLPADMESLIRSDAGAGAGVPGGAGGGPGAVAAVDAASCAARALSVRVRYAPSPTGEPHVGNLRSALFNWLMARHHGGAFIVRIEDTDQSRKVEGSVEQTLEALRWLGLDWDEGPEAGGAFGPYTQSERLAGYAAAAAGLVAAGEAYTCTCTPERLTALRRSQQQAKRPPGYDGRCRALSREERTREVAAAGSHVVRFAMPPSGETVVTDAVRGEVRFENGLLDDFVILKSDGFPTYHLANVVDDAAMEITHVLRAEEWLPSTPRHVQLYRALALPAAGVCAPADHLGGGRGQAEQAARGDECGGVPV